MRYISDKLRSFVKNRAENRCEYCLIPEAFLATIFHVEHIRSLKHKGKTVASNLAYSCPHCNRNKGTDVATFLDEDSNELIRLYNPRIDKWSDHFANNQGEIIGKTSIGIGTVRVLDFNQIERLILRKELYFLGLFP